MRDDDQDMDPDALAQNRICSACVGEPFLRVEIVEKGQDAECSYCQKTGPTIGIGDLADYVDTAFEDHYERTPSEPQGIEYLLAKEGLWDRHGEPVASVIGAAAQVEEDPAEHVRAVLSERHFDFDDASAGVENPFDGEAYYEDSGVRDYELQASWRHFQQSLKTESRFFNRVAEETLNSIFEDLGSHVTQHGRPVIVNAGPGTEMASLHRARVFQSDEKLKEALKHPDVELGPPPSPVASAGRMNARGIAVFYGATDAKVALAETRPPVGSKVAVARFDIIKPLQLLDIEALRSLYVNGSIFDKTFIERLRKAKFLSTLSHSITAPVMPDDEPSEYLITQAIADYLAAQNEPALDGIIYPSVQNGGDAKNVVLFHKSARVEAIELPPGTTMWAQTNPSDEDGVYPDYGVFEEVPRHKAEVGTAVADGGSKDDPRLHLFLGNPKLGGEDVREPTLRVATDSVKVHHVSRAEYETDEHDVSRHRLEKRDGEDF